MKHCLIMTAYKDAAQINRIIGITPPEWGIYIHIDRKSALKAEDIDSRARVMKRYTIHWGAYAHLQAFLTLMEEARQSGAGYDYYHLVTGQDYYASRPDRFDELIEPGNYIYMETYPYPRPNWWGDHYELVRIRSLAEYTDIRRPFGKMMELAYEWIQRITRTMQPVPPYPMYCGSVYLSLPADVVDWCLHSDIARDMQQRLKHCKIGEELYFQTVIMNSPFKERVVDSNLRFIIWNVARPPKFLVESDASAIASSATLFCRKVDTGRSGSLPDAIEKEWNLANVKV